jgi:hypothetical protein
MADTAPLKRIYFDTNILYRWPQLPNNIFFILRLANWLEAELYVPKVVDDELEGQYVRAVTAAYATLRANSRELDKLCSNVFDPNISGYRPTDKELREAYRTRTGQLKAHFQIATVPLISISTERLLEMAINRTPPFEAYSVSKDKSVVTGLQDTLILFSILDHLKGAAAGRYALATSDGVFQKSEVRALIKTHGVELEIFKNSGALFDDLWNHLWATVREEWRKEMEVVKARLEAQKEQLASQIALLLTPAEAGRGLFQNVKEIETVKVDKIYSVLTELPENLPPTTERYSRQEGSEVMISARIAIEMDAIVEDYAFSAIFAFANKTSDEPQPPPKPEERTISQSLNVSLTGKVYNGAIDGFQVTAIQVDR